MNKLTRPAGTYAIAIPDHADASVLIGRPEGTSPLFYMSYNGQEICRRYVKEEDITKWEDLTAYALCVFVDPLFRIPTFMELRDGKTIFIELDATSPIATPDRRIPLRIKYKEYDWSYISLPECILDTLWLRHDLTEFVKKHMNESASFYLKCIHDFIYEDEKVELRWNPIYDTEATLEMWIAGIKRLRTPVIPRELENQLAAEETAKGYIDRNNHRDADWIDDITDVEFEEEDLSTQFINACQKGMSGPGELTEIRINTKTKEISATVHYEHKIFL